MQIRSFADRLRTHTFSALILYPNFRLYWSGALTSNIGTWVQMVAQGWLVYQLTGSPLALGAVGFAQAIPNLFLALVGGVLADRFERRRLMIATQTGAMLLAFLLSFLTLSGLVTVWHIMAIAFLVGVVNSLNTPVRQSIISDLVPKEGLLNAIALSSAQFQTSRTLGPAVAGVLVAAVGPGWCFFINALSFLAVIWALVAMKLPPLSSGKPRSSMATNLTEGLRYVRSDATIMALLGLATVPSFFGMPYTQLMPAFAESVHSVGAEGLGLMLSAAGLGALLGALGIASLGKRAPRGIMMLGGIISFGLCLSALALAPSFLVSLVALVGAGASSMAYSALNQTFLQTLSDDAMRGRVLSLLTVATFGLQPLGSLAAGSVATALNPQAAVLIGGLVCALYAASMIVVRPAIRRLA